MPYNILKLIRQAEDLQRELERHLSSSVTEGLESLRPGAHWIGPGPPPPHTRNLPRALDDAIFRNLPSGRAREVAERLSGVMTLLEAAGAAETGYTGYRAARYLGSKAVGYAARKLAQKPPSLPAPYKPGATPARLASLERARAAKAVKGFGSKSPEVAAAVDDWDVVVRSSRFRRLDDRVKRLGYKLDPWLMPRLRSYFNPMRHVLGPARAPLVRQAPENFDAYIHFVNRVVGHSGDLKHHRQLTEYLSDRQAAGHLASFPSREMALDYARAKSAHELGFRTTKSELGAFQEAVDQMEKLASGRRGAYDVIAETLDRVPGAVRYGLQSPYKGFQWGSESSWLEKARRFAGGPTHARGRELSSEGWRWEFPDLEDFRKSWGERITPRFHGTPDETAPKATQWMDKYARGAYQTLIPGRTVWDHLYFKGGLVAGSYYAWSRDTEEDPWPVATTFLKKTPWERLQENLLIPYVFRSTNSPFLWRDSGNPIQPRTTEELQRDTAGFYGRISEGIITSGLYALGVPPGYGKQLRDQPVWNLRPSGATDEAVSWFKESEQASRRRSRNLWQDSRTMGFFRGAAEKAYGQMVGDAPRGDQERMDRVYRQLMRAASRVVGERSQALDTDLQGGGLQALMKDRFSSSRSMASAQRVEEMKALGYRSLRSSVNLKDKEALRGLSIPGRHYQQELKPWQRRANLPANQLFPGADFESLMEGLPSGAESFYHDNDRIEDHVKLQRRIYALDAGLKHKQGLIFKIRGLGDVEEAQKHVREYEELFGELKAMLKEDKRLAEKFAPAYEQLEKGARQKASDYADVIAGRTGSIGLLGPEGQSALLGDLRQEAGVLGNQPKLLEKAWDVLHGDLRKKYKMRKSVYEGERAEAADSGQGVQVAKLDAMWEQEAAALQKQISELNEYRDRIMSIIEKQAARTRANVERLEGGTAHSPLKHSAEQWKGGQPTAFGRWRPGWGDEDKDGVNTRDEVLARESSSAIIRNKRGRIDYGTWEGFYTGQTMRDPRDVQVDHVMSWSWARKHGLREAPRDVQESFYNDPLNLVVSQANENQRKGGLDPRQYRPPKNQEAYLQKFSQVAQKYSGWIDVPPDLQRMLPSDAQLADHESALAGARGGVGTGSLVSRMLGVGGDEGSIQSQILGTLLDIRGLLGGEAGVGGSRGRRILADRLSEQQEKEQAKARSEIMKRTQEALKVYNQGEEAEVEYREEREKGAREGLDEWWSKQKAEAYWEGLAFKQRNDNLQGHARLLDMAARARGSLTRSGMKDIERQQNLFLSSQDSGFNAYIEKQLELIERSKIGLKYMERVTDSIVRGFASALRYSRDIKETWAHIAASLLMTFGRQVIGALVGAVFNKLQAPSGPSLIGNTKSTGPVALTPPPGDGRQHGGQVLSGRSYLVGEGGQEEVFTPAETGQVQPLHRGMRGGAEGGMVVHMHFNIKSTDGPGVRAAAEEIRRVVVPEAARMAYGMVAQDQARPSPFNG